MKLNIFVSHAWADKEHSLLKKLMNQLQATTIAQVWIDKKHIDFGEKIPAKLESAIRDCDLFIVAWSRNAQASEAVNFELQCAQREGKRIVPCMIDDLGTDESEILSGLRYIKLIDNAARDQTQLTLLQNFLLRLQFEVTDPNDLPEAQREEWSLLKAKVSKLKDFFDEAQDIDHRQGMKVSGNDSSNEFVQPAIDAFQRTMASEPGQDKVLRFLAKMKEVSDRYPDRKDDDLKQRLMLEAIHEIDPAGEDESFADLRAQLEVQYADRVTPPKVPINPEVSHAEAREAGRQADRLTDILLAGSAAAPSRALQLFEVQRELRRGSAFLMEPTLAHDRNALEAAVMGMMVLREWCKENQAPDTENDVLWVMHICFSRLKQRSEAADALLPLQANLDAKAAALTDPKAINEVYDTYTLLKGALCEDLELAGRTAELARARARPN